MIVLYPDYLCITINSLVNAHTSSLLTPPTNSYLPFISSSFLQFSVYKQDDDNYARNMLTEAFRVYDRDDNGLIPLNDLRSILTTLGEPLTYEQMDELFQLIPVNEQGRIRSQDFINMLFTKWKI